jgi:hypothetical protein
VAVSADGKTLASGGSEDGILRIWDITTGKELAALRGEFDTVWAVAFTPDGNTLAAAEGPDTTIRLWDVSGLGGASGAPAVALSEKELEDSWAALGGDDAARAYRAIDALVKTPGQSVPLLKKRLRPVAAADAKRVARLITDLDNEDFAVRDRARRDLESLDEAAGPGLRKALAGRPSAEVRRSVEQLVAALDNPAGSPERLRVLRAIEVLEQIGTAEVRQVLQTLAGGLPEAQVTKEARAARDRLSDVPAPAPNPNPEPARPLDREGTTESLAVDPAGRWLVTQATDGTARLWDLKAADPAARGIVLGAPGKRPWAMAFTPGGRWLAVGSDDVTVRLYDLKAADPSAKSISLRSYVVLEKKLTFSPDGGWLAVGTAIHRPLLWDLRADNPTTRPVEIGVDQWIETFAFSSNGHWLVTTTPRREPEADGPEPSEAVVWDLRADIPARNSIVFPGRDSVIGDVAISPDDRWVVLREPDKTARLYDFESYRTLPEAERKAVAAIGPLGAEVRTAEGRIVTVRWRQGKINDAALELLKSFPHLRRLELLSCPVTDAGLAHVAGLKDLRELTVWNSRGITDAGLEHFKGLSQLERLKVSKTGVTGAGLRHLRGHRRLQSLNLKHNAISDQGIREIKALTGLKHLEMRNTGITDARLEQLTSLKDLEALGLWGNPLTEGCLKNLEKFGKLRALDISGLDVSEDGLKQLRRALPGLAEINEWGTAGPPQPQGPGKVPPAQK